MTADDHESCSSRSDCSFSSGGIPLLANRQLYAFTTDATLTVPLNILSLSQRQSYVFAINATLSFFPTGSINLQLAALHFGLASHLHRILCGSERVPSLSDLVALDYGRGNNSYSLFGGLERFHQYPVGTT